MSNPTPSLGNQLDWCAESTKHLQNLSYLITNAENTLNHTMTMLRQSCPQECVRLLLPAQKAYRVGAKETQQFIADHHLSYLESQGKFLSVKIDELLSSKRAGEL